MSKTSPKPSKSHVVILKQRLDRSGGLEKATRTLCDAFIHAGCRLTILCLGSAPHADHPNTEIISLGPISRLSVVNLRRFDRLAQEWLLKHPADTVFGLDRNTQQTHYRAGNGVHAAYLDHRRSCEPWHKALSFWANPLHRTLLSYERAAFTDLKLKQIFVNSTMVAEELRDYYNVDLSRVSIVHNGTPWSELEPAFSQWEDQRQQWLTEHNLTKDAFHLLFAGHGYRRKGLDLLIQAVARLSTQDIHLHVIGHERKEALFHRQVQRAGLRDRVHFHGAVPSILPFLHMSDALAIPSVYDPFANVTVEALALGVPVLSSPFNGGKEVIKKDCGATFASLDPDAIAETLGRALLYPKTAAIASRCRESVRHLDSQKLLHSLVHQTLNR